MGLQYKMNTCNLETQNLKIQNFGNNSQSLIFGTFQNWGFQVTDKGVDKDANTLHEIVQNLKDI